VKTNVPIDPDAPFGDDPKGAPDAGRAYRGLTGEHAEYKDLLGQLDREVKVWLPEPGDQIIGQVVGVTTAESDYGEYPLVELDTPDGAMVQVHCFHAILKSEIERRAPADGDRLAIRYLGRDVPKKGQSEGMARYRVVVVRAATFEPQS
jgi:hypothetical protein